MAFWFSSLRNALTWNPYSCERTPRRERLLKLPDLFAPLHDNSCEFRINVRCREVLDASDEWIRGELAKDRRLRVENTAAEQGQLPARNFKAGLLAALCYPSADVTQLRLCADVLNWIMHFEAQVAVMEHTASRSLIREVLDVLDTPRREVADGFALALQSALGGLPRSTPRISERISQRLRSYLRMVDQQVSDARENIIPDLESYISMHRESGWAKILFTLIEHSQGIDISDDEWRRNKTLRTFVEAVGDVLLYSTDILIRTGRGPHLSDTSSHNVVSLLMREQSMDLQHAVTHAGELYASRVRDFLSLKASLLSPRRSRMTFDVSRQSFDLFSRGSKSVDLMRGRSSDTEIAAYVRGVSDCLRGVLYWSFESERYFGVQGAQVKLHRAVDKALVRP